MTKRILLSIAVAVILVSCSENEDLLMSEINSESVQTRSANNVSPWFDWENTDRIVIPNHPGGSTLLPWISGSGSTIPLSVLEDYKQQDGWVMVYNNISRLEGFVDKTYYLIFYNKFTGILRSYYYHTETVGSGTTTFWQLTLSTETALLNTSSYFAKPMDVRHPDQRRVFVPNMTTVKGLSRGWNVFDIELGYDERLPIIPVEMAIGAQTYTGVEFDINGSLTFTSEETVITTTSSTSSNNVFQSIGNAVAGGVGSAVNGIVRDDPKVMGTIKNLGNAALSALSGGITTQLLNAGANLIFGSFTGRRNPPQTTTQTTRFTANGAITLKATGASHTGSEVSGINRLNIPGTVGAATSPFIPSYNLPLGVWNIRSQPIVMMSDATIWAATHIEYEEVGDPMMPMPGLGLHSYYDVNCIPRRNFHLDRNSVHVVINPEVLKLIDRHEVAMELVNYNRFQGKENWRVQFDGVEPELDIYLTPRGASGTVLFSSNDTEIVRNPIMRQTAQSLLIRKCVHGQHCVPGVVRHTPGPFDTNFVVKVTVTLYPKAFHNGQGYNIEPIIMTRSYLPEYRIFNEYNNIKHLYTGAIPR